MAIHKPEHDPVAEILEPFRGEVDDLLLLMAYATMTNQLPDIPETPTQRMRSRKGNNQSKSKTKRQTEVANRRKIINNR